MVSAATGVSWCFIRKLNVIDILLRAFRSIPCKIGQSLHYLRTFIVCFFRGTFSVFTCISRSFSRGACIQWANTKTKQNNLQKQFHWFVIPFITTVNGCTQPYYYVAIYSKICVKRPLAKRPKIAFQDQFSLNAGQKYCRILQYFWPSLSYHLSLRSLFCLFLSDRLRQVLLYIMFCASTRGFETYRICANVSFIRPCRRMQQS